MSRSSCRILSSLDEFPARTTYPLSKTLNILFGYELARRLAGTGVSANCADPGTGRTFVKCRPVPTSALTRDETASRRLWERSAELVEHPSTRRPSSPFDRRMARWRT